MKKLLNIATLTLIAVLIFLKSLNTEITIDEAYSFLNYSVTGDFLNVGIANNHILNSFLVSLTTLIGISEFFIRLPNFISGLLYLYFVLQLSKNKNYSLGVTSILIFNPYLIDYFSISRGYGISASLLFIAAYLYVNSTRNHIVVPLLILSISTFAIHTTVIFLILFWIANLKYAFKNYNKIFFFFLNLYLICISFINIYLLFLITDEKKPLFGIPDISISNLFFDSFGLNGLYSSKYSLFSFLILLLFLQPLLLYKKFNSRYKSLFLISYSSLLCLFIVPYVFGKPYPLLRILLPFLPPILILITESFTILQKKLSKKLFNMFISTVNGLLIFNFINVIDINKTIDWKDGLTKEEVLEISEFSCSYTLKFEDLDYVGHYYRFVEEDLNNSECQK